MLPRNKHVVHFSKNSYSLISKQIIVIVQSVTTLEKRNQSIWVCDFNNQWFKSNIIQIKSFDFHLNKSRKENQ